MRGVKWGETRGRGDGPVGSFLLCLCISVENAVALQKSRKQQGNGCYSASPPSPVWISQNVGQGKKTYETIIKREKKLWE